MIDFIRIFKTWDIFHFIIAIISTFMVRYNVISEEFWVIFLLYYLQSFLEMSNEENHVFDVNQLARTISNYHPPTKEMHTMGMKFIVQKDPYTIDWYMYGYSDKIRLYVLLVYLLALFRFSLNHHPTTTARHTTIVKFMVQKR